MEDGWKAPDSPMMSLPPKWVKRGGRGRGGRGRGGGGGGGGRGGKGKVVTHKTGREEDGAGVDNRAGYTMKQRTEIFALSRAPIVDLLVSSSP
eukprot:764948-Hanusia_phi.AAC.8